MSVRKVAADRFWGEKGVRAAEFRVDPVEWRLESV